MSSTSGKRYIMALAVMIYAVPSPYVLAADEPKAITVEELDKIPEGIKVVNDPKRVLATETGKSERRSKYTWWYKTTVSAVDDNITILEFGVLVYKDKKWVPGGTLTGKPYTSTEFAEWYNCPKALLKKGEMYIEPSNWSSDPGNRSRVGVLENKGY